jgi:hypothetical protein
MSISLNTSTPLSYQDWANEQGSSGDTSQRVYLDYLNSWYQNSNTKNSSYTISQSVKQQYIQLIKDLTHLFNQDERDLFLSDIDYTKDEDLIYVIPYIAHKLKEISQIIISKREFLKRTKTRDSLNGSNLGLENVLYEYVLNNFTKKDYSYTRVPVSPLASFYPELSEVKEDFFIEIEELYDKNNYHDSDPSISIDEYISFTDAEPFTDLSDSEINGLLSTRFLSRVAPTPLSKIFNQYLTSFSTLSTLALSSSFTSLINNQIIGSQKYLGENVYGLTAVPLTEDNRPPDYIMNLDFQYGNNWFYWPSGDKITNEDVFTNIFEPLNINDSNFTLNRYVTGNSYLDSDLIFTDKNGVIEGAWLKGISQQTVYDTLAKTLKANDTTSFLFPYVGFKLDYKSLDFKEYSINDESQPLFEVLDPTIKQKILSKYYTSSTPLSSGSDLYLNQTSLVNQGSLAGKFSDVADNIIKRENNLRINSVYSDNSLSATEQAFLYKFDYTNLPISVGDNNIYWPLTVIDSTTSNVPATLDKEVCLPIALKDIHNGYAMSGAVAGTTLNEADVIYKLNFGVNNDPIEAAWLGSGSLSQLDIVNSIPVYDTPATHCANYIDSSIQSSLNFKVNEGGYTSFIWLGPDTPAEDVFYYCKHSSDCAYGKSFPHDFYTNQDYQNPNPLNNTKSFPLNTHPCTCKAVNHSPIGNQGQTLKDYYGMADYLFADPFGLGSSFKIDNWIDTRGLNVYNSPQFSFFQIDGTKDLDIGFGTGKWQTGNNKPMILKTGRRYTYYRNPLKISTASTNATVPYLVINHVYNNLSINCPNNFSGQVDLVVLLDNSRSQRFDIDTVKQLLKSLAVSINNTQADVKISLISFDSNVKLLSFLTKDIYYILDKINQTNIEDYPNFSTNISDALQLAQTILYTNYPADNRCSVSNLSGACIDLNETINQVAELPSYDNCPRPNASKKILIFSDGQETNNIGQAIPIALQIKNTGVEITSMDIGYYASYNQIMETMSSDGCYFNLRNYLLDSDGDLNNFIQYYSLKLLGCGPGIPSWYKAILSSNGSWTQTFIPSDMVLRPGDYIKYSHRSSVIHTDALKGSFNTPSISFPINVKLDGWDYGTNQYSLSAVGVNFGAKPFWGKVYVNTDSVNNFNKQTMSFAGQIRFVNDYVPISQPEISQMVLNNNCYIEYINRSNRNIDWKEFLPFTVPTFNIQWNKLIINKEAPNSCYNLTPSTLLNLVTYSTDEKSDLTLESYSDFKPAKYNYYSRNPFKYTQNLYNINFCNNSFFPVVSSLVTEAMEPYANLDNVHFPTVATVSFPSNMVSKTQTGGYMSPDRFGTSYYRGKGYNISLDLNSVTYFNSISAELLFLDIEKYGPRNRGLSKNDQLAPVIINHVDNSWMFQPYYAGKVAGTIIDTVNNQKLVPYQSSYEIDTKNQIGLSTQSDNFQFWDPNNFKVWTGGPNYPPTFRNELSFNSYNDRITSLLTNKGVLNQWRTDVFGNNYGLFKS